MDRWIASGGFWHCVWIIILVFFGSAIFGGIIAYLTRSIMRKFFSDFEDMVTFFSSIALAFSFFYIWRIRHGVIWLILGIITAIVLFIFAIMSIISALEDKKKINEQNKNAFVSGNKRDNKIKEKWLKKLRVVYNPNEIDELFEKIPVEIRNMPGFLTEAVSMKAFVFNLLSDTEKTPEICLIAVKKDASLFKDIPDHLKTQEICKYALQWGSNLEFVPEQFKTQEICILAAQNGSSALKFVPEQFKSKDLCVTALLKAKNEDKIDKLYKKIRDESYASTDYFDIALEYVPTEIKEEVLRSIQKKTGE
jgi:hypothetical protein